MKTLSINGAFKRGWHLFKGHWQMLIIIDLVFFVLSFFQDLFDREWQELSLFSLLISIGFFFIQQILIIGSIKIFLHIEDGEKTRVGELLDHTKLLWKYLGTYILSMLMWFVGTILFIIPGIYLFLKYNFAGMFIVDKNTSISGAFAASAKATEGIKWNLLGFFIVMIIFNILGMLAFVVGLLITLPVSCLAYTHIYRKLSRHS